MNSRKIISNPNPRENANCFSVLTWAWTINLFKKGYNKILGVDDLYDPISSDRSNILGDRLEKQWLAEVDKSMRTNRRPSLVRAIFQAFSFDFFIVGIYVIILEFVLKLSTPKFLGAFLNYFKPESETSFATVLCYAIGIVITSLFSAIVTGHNFFLGPYATTKLRISISSVVYRKALRLNSTVVNHIAPGKIVNLVASDVNRFHVFFLFLHYMWSAPLLSIIILGYLYSEIGWSALVGFLFVVLDVPFQSYMGKLQSKLRLQTSIRTDERVRLMNEIISGVQVIKMYSWEKPFCSLIELARRLELKVVRKSSYIKGMIYTFFLFTTRVALYGTLITMMLRGQEITVDKVFVYMSYFNLMAVSMSYMFVRGISEVSECRVALKRLQEFLMHDEFKCENLIGKDVVENDIEDADKTIGAMELDPFIEPSVKDLQMQNGINKDGNPTSDGWAVKLESVSAKWDLNSAKMTLDNIDVKVDEGKLYVVIGTVGAGKTSFIASILGELKLIHGTKRINGRISYASQDAWVFGASVRQNITFGEDFDRQKYQDVVNVCALQQDFEQFPQGDQTIVGERGSSLSGGQKARINLARTVYREADIYLLDDPLSAVDARVSKLLFEDCIQKYLANKTRILATHQLQYVKAADAIILLDEGKLYQFNDYDGLISFHPEYKNLITVERVIESIELESLDADRKNSSLDLKNQTNENRNESVDADLTVEEDNTSDDDFYEKTSRGSVKGNLLVNYLKSGVNAISALSVPFLFLVTQFCVGLNDWFIPVFVNAEESRNHYNQSTLQMEENMPSREKYMYIYTAIVFSILLVGLTRSLTFYTICLRSSQRLHDLAFSALIHAPMRFFDTNPSGRILNRFSKDLGSIDEVLPWTLLDASQSIMIISGALVVSCTVNPLFLVPILLIGGLFYFMRKVFLKTSENMRRVEGITRAPIFTHLNATLNGITTIRAYGAQSLLEKEFDRLQDTHISSWFMFTSLSAAFGFYLDFFCFVFVCMVTFSCLLLRESFTGGVVGLAITQVMSLAGWLQWGIRQSAEVANELMSVERVLEYSQLEPESNLRDEGIISKKKIKKFKEGINNNTQFTELPKDWPSKGQIEFKNVYLRYSHENQPVLKNLTITILPGEKVGIVGRTGAGKSSLISALFRLAKLEGIIEIDGIDTSTIALEDLRKHISIIPQDPVIFSGTLRYNLDPFNEFSDEQLWNGLEEVELKEAQQSTGNGLDHRVLDQGSNYSTGQRQLICLARAVLRNNRILILDEATANVDPQTDALIQRTMRTKFAQCTVLTIAHRLNTIMDSDKVLVLDQGQLLEFHHPHVLLQNENGPFSSLVKETGQATYEQLERVAHDSFVYKYPVEAQ